MKKAQIVFSVMMMVLGTKANAFATPTRVTTEGKADKVEKGFVYRFGQVDPSVREMLAALWTDSAVVNERSGCVNAFLKGGSQPASDHSVDSTFQARSIQMNGEATEGSSSPTCKAGVPTFHTHPYQTCKRTVEGKSIDCELGGWYASICNPSKADLTALRKSGSPFAIIQCGKNSFTFYYPSWT